MTQRVKKVSLITTLVVCLFSITFSLISLFAVADEGAGQEVSATFELSQELDAQYVRNAHLAVPKGEFTYQGEKVAAQSYLTFPDGRTSAYSEIRLDEEGEYSLVYSAEVEGVKLQEEYQFNVISKASSLFATDSSVVFTNNYNTPDYTEAQYNGLAISIPNAGTVLRYEGVIDLSDNTQDNTFFEFVFTPQKNGDVEVQNMYITLTDVYDADNYITIMIRPITAGPYLFVTQVSAKASMSQDPLFIGNNPGSIAGKYAGYDTTASAHGKKEFVNELGNEQLTTSVPLTLKFDYQERALFASPSVIANSVVDFDDPDLVGLGNEWYGFTTGEVYMEVELESKLMSVESANITVLNIDGRNMGGEKIEDLSAPKINLDLKGNDASNLPYALVGQEFEIFKATVYDDVDGFVYYYDVDVYAENGAPLILNDGKFIPTAAGEYTITYTARDKFGRVAVRNEKIQAYTENVMDFGYEFKTVVEDISVGLDYKIEDGTPSGGSGVLKVERRLSYNGQEYEIMDGYFKPLYEGEYVLSYKLTDYLGNTAIFAHTMTATYLDAPVIDAFKLPASLIQGSTYTFPVVTAYDYEADQLVYCDLFVNGVKVDGYNYTLTEAGVITVKYVAFSALNGSNYSVTEDYKINVKELDKTNGTTFFSSYFDCENVTLQAQKLDVLFETSSMYNKVSFIRPIPVKDWGIMFDVVAEKNNFSALSITLTDSQNAEQQVQFKIQKNSNQAAVTSIFTINDRTKATMMGSFYGNSKVPFKVSLSDGKIYDYNKNYVSVIEEYLNGKTYTGFTSQLVYVDLEFCDISGESAITLNTLSNQTFGELTKDSIEPIIVLEKEYSEYFVELNSKYTIYSAKAYDVLQENVTLKAIVSAPDGSTVYEGAIDKEQTLVLSQMGTYIIEYEARDANMGRKKELKYYISVADIQAPTISCNGNVATMLNIGDVLTIPTFTFSDDISKEVYSMIYIIEPSGKLVMVKDQYEAKTMGRHTLWVYASDEFGNIALQEFTFYVK